MIVAIKTPKELTPIIPLNDKGNERGYDERGVIVRELWLLFALFFPREDFVGDVCIFDSFDTFGLLPLVVVKRGVRVVFIDPLAGYVIRLFVNSQQHF